MSVNSMELVLYEISTSGRIAEKFKEDPDSFLGRFSLTDDEKNLIHQADVGTMRAKGVSPILTMGFWLSVRGRREMGEYMKRMKAGGVEENG